MADVPIIFSAPMVKALLDGRKTMTRRLAWREIAGDRQVPKNAVTRQVGHMVRGVVPTPWQRVKAGDRLGVRENHFRWGLWDYQPSRAQKWKFFPSGTDNHRFIEQMVDGYEAPRRSPGRLAWYLRPSIYHPREFSRLTLTVTATKIERLQDISDDDAIADGAFREIESHVFGLDDVHYGATPRLAFAELWRSLHGPDAWDSNPECVVLTFTVAKQNIDAMQRAA